MATEVTIDLTDLELEYGATAKFEFRYYYSSHWDNSVKDMVPNTVTLTDISVNGSGSSSGTDDPTPSGDTHNRQSNGTNCPDDVPWEVTDNGDGTATLKSTVARQLSDLDITLTLGYDEDYYALHPTEFTEDAPINSHKFTYADFGLTNTTGVTVESITAVIQPDVDMDQFMYGGGLNVENKSIADTEYAKQIAGIEGKESAGYWYNDMGADGVEEMEDAGVEFGVPVGNGVTIEGAGSYIVAYWEMPAEVQPYESLRGNDAISFQYWWGNDTDGEEVESVTLTDACLTYTKEITVPYTDKVQTAVKATVDHTSKTNYVEVPYSELGVDETKDVYAVLFDISAKSDIGKLVYNIGSSAEIDGDWYQDDTSYVVLDAGDSAQILWIAPKDLISADGSLVNSSKYGNIQFAYYWGEEDSITIDNITVFYADAPETTTTTTTTTTAPPTTTTTTTTTPVTEPEPKVTIWGDANVDGKVDLQDAVAILQYAALPAKYPLTDQGLLNADVVDNGTSGVNGIDALSIQMADAKLLDKDSDWPITKAAQDAKLK